MPEGDALRRAAAALRTALVGKPLVQFTAPGLVGPAPTPGRVVERVESRGRHLDVCFDDGLVLHTNLRMTGAWHLYRLDARWRRPGSQLRVELLTREWVAACFSAPVVETYRQLDRSRHPGAGSLGPDLAHPAADVEDAIDRLYHHEPPTTAVADALLDDHVARSVGNAYRSEALWAAGLFPFAPVVELDADDCATVVRAAARLVRDRLVGSGDLVVYGRNGQPCPRCHGTVEVCRTGRHQRLLYWCPGCQVHRAPAPVVVEEPADDEVREMDPHPAAVKFLHDLPWRRHRAAG